jgi:pyridinium-3,5-biscarboxylic acid mononucleotide synthase
VDPQRLTGLLERVRAGEVSVADALGELRAFPYQKLGWATVDHHRALRQGFPEVVFGEPKTAEQIVGIVRELRAAGADVLVTRVGADKAERVRAELPELRFEPAARALVHQDRWEDRGRGTVLVVSAGTSDIPVAEEAALTAHLMGNRVERLFDVGVAGIHRILDQREILHSSSVIVVVAGMEGALASVVGGLCGRPIVAVPTSVGYGASFSGLAALLGMLNSCAAGVSVVNIDNGYGAGVAAALINRR